jgi:SAM-dependent methyltransferase
MSEPEHGHPARGHTGHTGHTADQDGHGHDQAGPYHDQAGPYDDWDARAEDLERDGEIGLSWFESAAAWIAELATVAGSDVRQILDVGSGPGVASCVLAGRFPGARVIAVDSSPGLLVRAKDRAARLGVAERVDTLNASLDGDLTGLPEADVIWASRVLHHIPNQAKALRSLAGRLRRPGGMLAILEGGLPSRFLPIECGIGEPGLLERLDAAVAKNLTTLLRHGADSPVPRPVLDWPAQLAEAGMTPTGSRSFLLDLPAPVAPAVRAHLIRRVGRTSSLGGEHLLADDLRTLEALLDPEHPLGLHRRPDLFLLSAVTVHTAREPS